MSGSNVVGTARDVHIYQTPPTFPTAQSKGRAEEWDEGEEFTLEPGGYRYVPLEISVGNKLSGLVEAEGSVSCYVLGPNSLQSFEDDEEFNPHWETEGVTRSKVSFKPKSGHKFFFVVYLDEDADEDVSVSVKLRTEK